MRKWLLLLFLMFNFLGQSYADEYKTLFQQGNQFYDNGNYQAAVKAYEKIISGGRGNWQVFYNLGNAFFRLHELGEAILFYEKALKLNPDNEDIRFNLELANLSVVDRIPEPPKQPFVVWIERILLGPSFSYLLWLTLGLYALGVILLAMKYFWPRIQKFHFYRLLFGANLIAFAAILLVFSFRWYKMGSEKFAIVLPQEVSVTSSPTEDATEVFALHEGTKLQVQELSGKWARIRLRDGKIGWIQLEAIGMI